MITKFKIFETKLRNLPYPINIKRRINIKEYKYEINDIVVHKELSIPYLVKDINKFSDNQDYWIVNPIIGDSGFVLEEELRDAKPSEKEELLAYIDMEKYNL